MSGVRLERRDAVLLITIDRPKVNAIDVAASRRLGEAFVELRDDAALRAAVLTGAGAQTFCAGWDMKAALAKGENESSDYGVGGFGGLAQMFDLYKPVIAAVNGAAVGGGFELVLAADLVVAAEHAAFWLPETQLGVMADAGGIQILPRRVPRPIAFEMLFLGRRMNATEAARWGVVNHVLPSAEVLPKALEIARELSERAPLALQAIKEVAAGIEYLPLSQAFAAVSARRFPIYSSMLRSADHEEGVRAFLEKRPPRFKGW